jgi:hypothetical protein
MVRIDLPRGKSAEYRRTIGDVVYDAMVKTINVPANDRFQVITEHAPENLIVDRTYLGIERTAECILIQVVLNEGADHRAEEGLLPGRRRASTSGSACASRTSPSAWWK